MKRMNQAISIPNPLGILLSLLALVFLAEQALRNPAETSGQTIQVRYRIPYGRRQALHLRYVPNVLEKYPILMLAPAQGRAYDATYRGWLDLPSVREGGHFVFQDVARVFHV